MLKKKLLEVIDCKSYGKVDFLSARLTIDGWEFWEELRRGRKVGSTGLIAMPFGEETLARFVEDVVKPAVESIPGLTLVRVDDQPKAGVIDNILRELIKDAPFVIADLTHANNGAYWEAGFAEGLGKPVIYMCEESVWKAKRTHFDTNHCTTIFWSEDRPDEFTGSLVATIRNSLNLF